MIMMYVLGAAYGLTKYELNIKILIYIVYMYIILVVDANGIISVKLQIFGLYYYSCGG